MDSDHTYRNPDPLLYSLHNNISAIFRACSESLRDPLIVYIDLITGSRVSGDSRAFVRNIMYRKKVDLAYWLVGMVICGSHRKRRKTNRGRSHRADGRGRVGSFSRKLRPVHHLTVFFMYRVISEIKRLVILFLQESVNRRSCIFCNLSFLLSWGLIGR